MSALTYTQRSACGYEVTGTMENGEITYQVHAADGTLGELFWFGAVFPRAAARAEECRCPIPDECVSHTLWQIETTLEDQAKAV